MFFGLMWGGFVNVINCEFSLRCAPQEKLWKLLNGTRELCIMRKHFMDFNGFSVEHSGKYKYWFYYTNVFF